MRPAGAHGEVHLRLHPGRVQLEPGKILEAPAAVGISMLDGLDRLGERVALRYAAHRAAMPPKRRISAPSAVALTGAVALAGLFGWGAIEANAGANQWMNAPGAGNAEAAAAATPAPVAHRAAASPPATAGPTPAVAAAHHGAPALTVHETLVLLDGGMTGHPGSPEIVGSSRIDFPAHAKVVLTIYSFDDGPAPLAKGIPYDKVMGTAGGTESYDGATISSVPNAVIAHTFTVPGIGLNLPIPAAKSAKSGAITPAVVTASFETTKTGSFTWQCYAPCGSGKDGNGGAMKTAGDMTGKVVIG